MRMRAVCLFRINFHGGSEEHRAHPATGRSQQQQQQQQQISLKIEK